MRFLLTMVFVGFLAILPVSALASNESPLVFQVLLDQFTFDYQFIQKASMLQKKDKSFNGLVIELKPDARETFNKLTTMGTGRFANLVFEGKIVSTSLLRSQLGGKLLISGITREQAQRFIDYLAQQQHQQKMPPKKIKPVLFGNTEFLN